MREEQMKKLKMRINIIVFVGFVLGNINAILFYYLFLR